MRLGFILPQLGPAASPDAIISVAQRAEALGYGSLWVTDRVLYPVQPQTPYMGSPDGSLPEPYKIVLDPLHTLTFAAAHTSRIALGTSILDMPFYNPVLLARSLTTLDVLSGGRLRVGLGQGWSQDEHDAAGGSMKTRGPRADEFIQVLKAIWTTDPVEFQGKFFQIPESIIQPKPVQKPHPPIYLAGYAPGAMQRVASAADGWFPASVPEAEMMESLRGMARQAGRNPSDIKLIIRANLHVTGAPLGDQRWPFTGSLDEITSDIQGAKKVGADELFFDPTFSPNGTSLEGYLSRLEQMKQLADGA